MKTDKTPKASGGNKVIPFSLKAKLAAMGVLLGTRASTEKGGLNAFH